MILVGENVFGGSMVLGIILLLAKTLFDIEGKEAVVVEVLFWALFFGVLHTLFSLILVRLGVKEAVERRAKGAAIVEKGGGVPSGTETQASV